MSTDNRISSMMETTPEGVLRVHLELSIDAREMREWPTQCVSAFFDGIARAQEATTHARAAMMERQRDTAAARPTSAPPSPERSRDHG